MQINENQIKSISSNKIITSVDRQFVSQSEKDLWTTKANEMSSMVSVDTSEEMWAIEVNESHIGNLCYVKGENKTFQLTLEPMGDSDELYWKEFHNYEEVFLVPTITSNFNTDVVKKGEEVVLTYFFSSPNIGDGTLKLSVQERSSGHLETHEETIKQGLNKIEISRFLSKGTNEIQLYVIDRADQVSNDLTFSLLCGALELTSTFESGDFELSKEIEIPLNIDDINKGKYPLTIIYNLDGQEYTQEATNGYNIIKLGLLPMGAHKIEIMVSNELFESNKLEYTVVVVSSTDLYLSSDMKVFTYEEGYTIPFEYRISMKGQTSFVVKYYINDELNKEVVGNNGVNYWNISGLKEGIHNIKIEVFTRQGDISAELNYELTITESTFEFIKPVMDSSLVAFFDASNNTNNDLDKETWTDSINGYKAKLHGYNFRTNGWVNGRLVSNSSSYTEIEYKPLRNNAENGMTIELYYKTKDIGNQSARVIDCTSTDGKERGFFIDTLDIHLRSNDNVFKSMFSEDEMVHVLFVIDRKFRLENGNPQPMAQIYVNGVISELILLSDNDAVLESFRCDENIFINSRKGTDCFGDNEIEFIRVYDRALNYEEAVQNFISCHKTREEQQELININYNNTMPSMIFNTTEQDFELMTKDNRIWMSVTYIDTSGQTSSFTKQNVYTSWQGTSSLQYAIKNYKLRFYTDEDRKVKDYFTVFGEDTIPENVYTLKADYMESSHANNTGCARFVDDILYDEPIPPKKFDNRIRTTINGFPIKLYVNRGKGNEFWGVYNFNHDKNCETTFGFKMKHEELPEIASYEVSANGDTGAGAFHKYDGNPEDIEARNEYYLRDFEIRYSKTDNLEPIIKLVEWVSDADDETFRNELHLHFNKHYLYRYFLHVMMIGGVDNLGKNMMLNTWDGEIFYPNFYDMDTILGLDNTGYLVIESDVEMGDYGVFNTSQSQLWVKLQRVMWDEICAEYRKMRNGKYTLENLFKYFIDYQIDKIGALQYNLDCYRKYIPYGKQYAHVIHGSRKEHMKRWLSERMVYLDSFLLQQESPSTKTSITLRINKMGPVHLDIQTYSPQYVTVKWRNNQYERIRLRRGQTGHFTANIPTATDQEVLIYNAPYLKDIGDLSHLNPKAMEVAQATRLTKLSCKAPDLINVDVSKNKFLKELDLSGCPKMGSASGGSNSLNVTGCDNLRFIDVRGTLITQIMTNPNGGNLEEIYYSDKVSSIVLQKQTNLKKIHVPEEARDLVTLYVDSCPQLEYEGYNTLQTLTVIDSFDGLERFDLKLFPQLRELRLQTIPSLKEISFDDMGTDTPLVERVQLYDLLNVKTVTLNETERGRLPLFVQGTELDLSNLPRLETVTSNVGIKGLTKVILPKSIKNLSFTYNETSNKFSDIEDMWIGANSHLDDGFKGIDYLDMELDQFNIDTLVKTKKLINLVYPVINNTLPEVTNDGFNGLRDEGDFEHIIVEHPIFDFSNYESDNLVGMFRDVDMSTLSIRTKNLLPNVSDVSYLFANATNLKTDEIKDFVIKLNGLVNMSNIFFNCTSLKKLPDIKTTNVTNMENAFYNCSNMIGFVEREKYWNKQPVVVESYSNAFHECRKLLNYDFIPVEWGKSNEYSLSYKIKGSSNIEETLPTCHNGNIESVIITLKSGELTDDLTTDIRFVESINVRFTPETEGIKFTNNEFISELLFMDSRNITDMSHMFEGCKLLAKLPAELDTENVVNMNSMFKGCESVTEIPSMDTSHVEDMSYMFTSCRRLSVLPTLDTTSVRNMSHMFDSCSSIKINQHTKWLILKNIFFGTKNIYSLNLYNTSNVENMDYMFNECQRLEKALNFDMGNVTSCEGMYKGCLSLNVDIDFILPEARNISHMFSNCSTIQHIPNMYIPKVTNVTELYKDCIKMNGVADATVYWNNTRIKQFANAFKGCSSLINQSMIPSEWGGLANEYYIDFTLNSTFARPEDTILDFLPRLFINNGTSEPIDLFFTLNDGSITSDLQTSVINIKSVFMSLDPKVTKVQFERTGVLLKEITYINTKLFKSFDKMFKDCSELRTLPELNANSCTSAVEMFKNCRLLETVSLSNTLNISNMNNMFENCTSLSYINEFNTSSLETAKFMFKDCMLLEEIPQFNTSVLRDASYMFAGCTSLTSIPLLNLSSLENMDFMFYDCSNLSSIPQFNTSNVITMKNTFQKCIDLYEIPLLNMSKVETSEYMFNQCINLVSVSNLDLSNVKNVSHMFEDCSALILVPNLNVQSAIDLSYMFHNCENIVSIPQLNIVEGTNVTSLFDGCLKMSGLALPFSYWVNENITEFSNCFRGCDYLDNINFVPFNWGGKLSEYHLSFNINSTIYNTSDTVSDIVPKLYIDNIESLNFGFQIYLKDNTITNDLSTPINLVKQVAMLTSPEINRISFEPTANYLSKVNYIKTDGFISFERMFANCTKLTSLDLTDFNTLGCNTEDMLLNIPSTTEIKIGLLFDKSSKDYGYKGKFIRPTSVVFTVDSSDSEANVSNILPSLTGGAYEDIITVTKDNQISDISEVLSNVKSVIAKYNSNVNSLKFNNKNENIASVVYVDTKNFTSLRNMFYNCSKATKIDVSEFVTEKVTDMYSLFNGCSSVKELDLSSFNTNKVTTMYSLFNGCSKLEKVDLSSLNTEKVTDMASMFNNCSSLIELDVTNFDTSLVTNMSYMFYGCSKITSLELSNFTTNLVTNMNSMFNRCSELRMLDLSGFVTSKVNNMYSMFSGCKKLESVDLSSFDTGNVTTMYSMFYMCNSLRSLNLSTFVTSKVNNMSYMFHNCESLTELDVNHFDTREVTTMSYMFNGCSLLSELNLSNFVTNNVKAMISMFNGCSNLLELDLSNFVTSNVTSAHSMFSKCNRLESLNVRSFDTSNIADMNNMFSGCINLTSLDLSSFTTDIVTNMSSMFSGCNNLVSLDLSRFKTSQVKSMADMFYNCNSLDLLDISGFTTPNVTNMSYMFYGCNNLTELDLSNFNTELVTNMSYMFYDCRSLSELQLFNFSTPEVTNMNSIFNRCSSLRTLDIRNFDTSKIGENSLAMFYEVNKNTNVIVGAKFTKSEFETSFTGTFNRVA